MVLAKSRIYNSNFEDPMPLTSVASQFTVLVNQHVPSGPTSAITLLRGRAEFTLSMAVGAPTSDVPSEGWWLRTEMILYAYWAPDATTGVLPADAEDEKYLGSVLLRKTFVASASLPTEYSVNYYTDDPLVTQTYRKPTGDVLGPAINWYLGVRDPEFVFAGGFTAVRAAWYVRTFSLWGQ